MPGSSLALALFMVVGCVRTYRPPTTNEPHATVKIRRVFETSAGTRLKEYAWVNGHRAEIASELVDLAKTPRASAILVHPTPAMLQIGGGFFHVETRLVTETYTVQVPYSATESYSCGTGTSYRTCTRAVTRYRSESRQRTVPRSVEVSDGDCSGAIHLAPKVGHIYLVDFTYRDNGVCSATCLEQVKIFSDGTFESAVCPRPSPEEEAMIEKANQ